MFNAICCDEKLSYLCWIQHQTKSHTCSWLHLMSTVFKQTQRNQYQATQTINISATESNYFLICSWKSNKLFCHIALNDLVPQYLWEFLPSLRRGWVPMWFLPHVVSGTSVLNITPMKTYWKHTQYFLTQVLHQIPFLSQP